MGFDTLLLYPDNDNIDTSQLFYSYWAYHNRNKFFWGYFDKRSPGNHLVDGNYEKWYFRKKNVLRIKNCKTKRSTFYKISVRKDDSNKTLSLLLSKEEGSFPVW